MSYDTSLSIPLESIHVLFLLTPYTISQIGEFPMVTSYNHLIMVYIKNDSLLYQIPAQSYFFPTRYL